jgi:hypothetical protein
MVTVKFRPNAAPATSITSNKSLTPT